VRRLALLTTPFLLFAIAIGLAPAAAAHGAEAALSVVSAEEQAGAVHYRVRVVYQNDGEPVPNVTPTAVVIAPDGTEAAPVTFAKADTAGEYEATVSFPAPGAWKVRFDVAEPEGTLTVDQAVAASTTVAPTTEAPTTEAPTTTDAPVATAPAVTTASTTESDDDGDDGESSGGGAVVVAALASGVVLMSAIVMSRRRRDRGKASD
jgi:hypothetical protein